MKKILALLIGILILFTAGCSGSKKTSYSPDSPEGAALAYYEALKDGKLETAYEYLKAPWSVSKEDFVKEKKGSGMTFEDVSVDKSQISGNTAVVDIKLKTGVSAMPELIRTVNLEKTDSWKISSFDAIGAMPEAAAPQGSSPHAAPNESGGGYDPSLVNPNGPGK